MEKSKFRFEFHWRKSLFIVLAVLIQNLVFSQSNFQKTYEGIHSIAYSLQTDNTGFILVGTARNTPQNGKDILVIKTDLSGNLIWSKTIGGDKDEVAYSVKKTSDNGIIIAGSTASYVSIPTDTSNFYVVKMDSNGNVEWTRSIGLDGIEIAKDIIESYDNNFIVLGSTNSIGAGDIDIYLMGLSNTGTLLWSNALGSTGVDLGNSILQKSNHELIIVGSTTGFNAGGEIPYLIKTSEVGAVLNPSFTFDLGTTVTTKKRYFTKIINGDVNEFAITGSDGLGSIGDAQHFILNIDTLINLNWMKKYYMNSGEGIGNSIERKSTGEYYIGGTMGIDRPALIKTDANGGLLTTMFYPDLSFSIYGRGQDLKLTTDGKLAFVGMRFTSSDTSAFLFKTDITTLSSGCQQQNGFINTDSDMTPSILQQTTSSSNAINFIAIDSGFVANYNPVINNICSTQDVNQSEEMNGDLKIEQSGSDIHFVWNDNENFISFINIYNMMGEKITQLKTGIFPTLGISSGIYFYEIITNQNLVFTGKVMIN